MDCHTCKDFPLCDVIDRIQDQLNEEKLQSQSLKSRLDAKSAALDKFGRHLPTCAITKSANMREDLRNYRAKCDCGFDAAKEA